MGVDHAGRRAWARPEVRLSAPWQGKRESVERVSRPRGASGVGAEGRPVNPRRRATHTVKRTEHPELAPFQLRGGRVGDRGRHAVSLRGSQDQRCSHARDARAGNRRSRQDSVAPPQQRAVGAVDEAALCIQNDGLAGTQRVNGRAEGKKGVQVGALDGRARARIVGCGGDDDVGRDGGRRAQPECQAAALTELDPGEPVARAGERGDNVAPEVGEAGKVGRWARVGVH